MNPLSMYALAVLALLCHHVTPLDFGGGGGSGEETVECTAPSILVDGACKVCAAGQYIGEDNCYDCAIGYYKDTAPTSTSDLCTQCTSPQSTLSTGSDSSTDCIDVCTVTLPDYAISVSPVETTNLATTSSITVTCNSGYQIEGANVHIEPCSATPSSCSGVHITASETKAMQDTAVTFTCTVISGEVPGTTAADCKWTMDNVEISGTTGTFSSTGNTDEYSCEYSIATVADTDEAEYKCEANIGTHHEVSSDSATLTVLAYSFDNAEVVSKYGESVTMSCDLDAPDSVTVGGIHWYKDSSEITEGVTTTSSGDPRTTVLIISDVELADTGSYKCEADYTGIGSLMSATLPLYIIDFVTAPANTVVRTGNQVDLTCEVSGSSDSAPIVFWTTSASDGVPTAVETPDGQTLKSVITITSAASTSAGDYVCTADFNSDFQMQSTATVSVFDVGFATDPADGEFNDGDDATLTCIMDTPSSAPYSSVGWFTEDGAGIGTVAITADDPTTDKSSLVMTITAATVSDNGKYYCSITYTDTDIGTISSGTANLYINGIVTSPMSINAALGGSTTLTCVIAGDVAGAVTWSFRLENEPTTFNDIDASADEEITITDTRDDANLQTTSLLKLVGIDQSTREGYYKATATFTNAATATSATAHVPVVDAEIAQAYALVAGSFSITCIIDAADEPDSIAWTVDGVPWTGTVAESHSATQETTSSVISKTSGVTEDDFGDYVCTAYFESSTVVVTSNTMTLFQMVISTPNVATTAIDDAAVTLSCVMTYPTGFTEVPTFTWTFANSDYDGTVTNTLTSELYETKIVFDHVAFTDAGAYVCKVQYANYDGELQSPGANLFVEGIYTHPSDLEIVKSYAGSYTCVVLTEVEPTVTWKKDSSSTLDDSDSKIDIVNTWAYSYSDTKHYMTSVLTLSLADTTTAGSYHCEAVEGSDTFTSNAAEVAILSMTNFPSTHAELADSTVMLTCAVTNSDQTITTSWYKDGVAITSGIVDSVVGNDWQSVLTLTSVGLANDAAYYCQVTYTAAGDFTGGALSSTSVDITIITVITDPANLYGQDGDPGSLSCVVYGDEEATISWYKDDVVITTGPTSADVYTATDGYTTSTLSWTSMVTANEGSYKCRAAYTAGTIDSAAATVSVYSVSIEQHPASVVTASSAGIVTLTCKASAPDGTVAPTIYWWQVSTDGDARGNGATQTDVVDQTTNYVVTSELAVGVSTGTSDGYYCKATYSTITVPIPSNIAYVYIRKFQTEPAATTVILAAASATLSCSILGDEPTAISWYFGDQVINSASLTAIDTGLYDTATLSQSSTLALNLVSTASAGTYTCKATYAADSPSELESTEAEVIVLQLTLPDINGVYSGSGSTVTCTCTSSTSEVAGSWYIEDGASTTYDVSPSNGEASVSISYTGFYTPDYYTCKATYTIDGTTYNVESSTASFVAISSSYDSYSSSVNMGSPITITLTVNNPNGDVSSFAWYWVAYNGAPVTSSVAATTSAFSTDIAMAIDSAGNTVTVNVGTTATTDNPFVATLTIADPEKGVPTVYKAYVGFSTSAETYTASTVARYSNYFDIEPSDNDYCWGGSAITVTCQTFGQSAATITWYNGNSVWGDSRSGVTQSETSTYTSTSGTAANPGAYYGYTTESTLVFESFSQDDGGDYKCSAVIGDLTFESTVATLTFLGFTQHPTFTKTAAGSSNPVTLTCILSAFSTTGTIFWYKDGNPTPVGTNTVANTPTNSEYPLASPSHDSDAGTYDCRVTMSGNDITSDEADLVIIEVTTPADADTPVEVEGYGDASVSLTCVSQGDIQASYWTWTKGASTAITIDNTKYTEVETYDTATYATTSVLTINNLASTDAASYSCKASYTQSSTTIEDEIDDSHEVTVRWDEFLKGYAMEDEETDFFDLCLWNDDSSTATWVIKSSTDDSTWSTELSYSAQGASSKHEMDTADLTKYWQCVSTDQSTNDAFTSPSLQLVVITKTDPTTPTQVLDTSETTSVSFSCQFGTTGDDKQEAASVEWKIDGTSITAVTGTYEISGPTVDANGVSTSTLTIYDTTASPLIGQDDDAVVCEMTYTSADAVSYVAVMDDQFFDLVEPVLTRAVTYGMIGHEMPFTCIIDSQAQPTEVWLYKDDLKIEVTDPGTGVTTVVVGTSTTTTTGAAGSWSASLTYTPAADTDFNSAFSCVAEVSSVEVTSIDYTISEITMTMTSRVTTGLSETLTCEVMAAAAPESVKWYSGSADDTLIATSANTYTYTPGTYDANSDDIQKSTLELVGTDSIPLTTDATYTCRVEFETDSTDAYEIINTAYLEVVDLEATGTATVGGTGSSSTVTCALTNSGKTPTSFTWRDGSGDVVHDGTDITIVAGSLNNEAWTTTVAIKEPTADNTFTCTVAYQADASNDIPEEAVLDFVVITTHSTESTGDAATVSCVLTESLALAVSSVKWTVSGSTTPIVTVASVSTVTDGTYTADQVNNPNEGTQTTSLTMIVPSADVTYECSFLFEADDSNTVKDEADIDFFIMVAPLAHTLEDPVTLTCSVSGANSAADVYWSLSSDGSTPLVTGGADYTITDPDAWVNSATTLVSYLNVLDDAIAADVTYYCVAEFASGAVITEETEVDFVEISTTGDESSGGQASLSCTLTGSSLAAAADLESTYSVTWEDSAGGAVITAAGITVTEGTFGGNQQVVSLTIDVPSEDEWYTCNFNFRGTDDTVSESVKLDFYTPTMSRATTYGMIGHAVPFTCTVDSDTKPTSVTLYRDGADASVTVLAAAMTGSAAAWIGEFAYTPADAAAFADGYSCFATVAASTGEGSEVALNQITMTMTDKVTTGLTETLSCAVSTLAVDHAPVSVQWYSGSADDTLIATTADTHTYTAGTYAEVEGPVYIQTAKLELVGTDSAPLTADATYTCRVAFDATDSYEIVEEAYIEVVSLVATHTATVGGTGSSSTVTCALTDSGKTPVSFTWEDGDGAVAHDGTDITIVAGTLNNGAWTTTVAIKEPTEDNTFTCTVAYQADGSNDIEEQPVLDFVVITATGVTTSGASTTISCVLSESLFATTDVQWADEDDDVETVASVTTVDDGTFAGTGQTMALTLDAPTEDQTYTCTFIYTASTNEVEEEVFVDFFEPVLSRATTYAMIDHASPFTCTIDSTVKPDTVSLYNGATVVDSVDFTTATDSATNNWYGAAEVWVAEMEYTPSATGDFSNAMKCEATVTGTTDISIDYVVSEITMTMTGKITTGPTETLTCDVLADAAPVSVSWYSGSATGDLIATSAGTYTYTAGTYDANSDDRQVSTLEVVGTDSAPIAADAVFTCRAKFDSANPYEIISDAILDWVVLTPSYFATTGDETEARCVLTESHTTPDSVSWTTGGSATPLTSSSSGLSSLSEGSYASNGQTMTLAQTAVAADTTYTCNIIYQSDDSNTISAEAVIDFVVITPASVESSGDAATVECVLTETTAAAISSVLWTISGSDTPIITVAAVTTVTDGTFTPGVATNDGTQTTSLTVLAPTADVVYECSFLFESDDSNTLTDTADIDHIVMEAPMAHTLDDPVTLTCSVSAANSGAIISWSLNSDGTSPLVSDDSAYTITDPDAYVDQNSVLTSTLEILADDTAADVTYYCVASYTTSGEEIILETEVDHVEIAVTDAESSGSAATISCVLSASSLAAAADLETTYEAVWVDSTGNEVVATSSLVITTGVFASNGQTLSMAVSAPTEDVLYTCQFRFRNSGDGNTEYDTVSEVAKIDFYDPEISRATTYGMIGHVVPFTCTVDSDVKPTSVTLYKGGSTTGVETLAAAMTGAAGAWIGEFAYTPADAAAFVDAYSCYAVVAATNGEGSGAVLSQITMTMVGKHTSGTDTTLSCTVAAAAAPTSIHWYSGSADDTKITAADSADYTLGDNAYSATVSGEQLSTLTVIGPDADATVTCRVSFDTDPNDYEIVSTAFLDHVTVTMYSAPSIGDATIVSCQVEDYRNTNPASVKWSIPVGTNDPATEDGYTAAEDNPSEEVYEMNMTVDAPTGDETYTCTFVWVADVDEVEAEVYIDHMVISATALLSDDDDPVITCLVSEAGTVGVVTWSGTTAGAITTNSDYSLTTDSTLQNTDEQETTLTLLSEADDTYTCTYTYADSDTALGTEFNGEFEATILFEAITVTMDDYFVDRVGTPATLNCAVEEASVEPTITWTDGSTTWDDSTASDASILPGDTEYTAEAKTSTLYFTATQAADTKEYTCTITISGMSITKTIWLYAINVAWPDAYGVDGDTFDTECIYTDDSDLYPATAIDIKKEQDDSTYDATGLILGTMTTTSPFSRSLDANPMTANDEGNYQCVITTDVFVYTSPDISVNMLSIAQELTGTVIETGSDYTFKCGFDNPAVYESDFSSDPLSVQYYLDGVAISGAVSTPTGSPGYATYAITGAASTNNGVYTCVATWGSTGSMTSADATLAVRGITTEISAQDQYAGYTVTLTCAVNGESQASIAWRRDGTEIDPQSPTETYTAPVTKSVLIQTVTSATEGDYSCLATWGDDYDVTTADAVIGILADCVAGEYLRVSDMSCQPCAIGTYTETSGLTSCDACSGSTTTLFAGSDSHNQCYELMEDYTEYVADWQSLTLECSITTSDTITATTWAYPNTTVITAGPEVTLTTNTEGYTTTYTVEIQYIDSQNYADDDGDYVCTWTAENPADSSDTATITTTATVEVLGITTQPTDQVATVGESLSLTCEGSPAPAGVSVYSQWLLYEDGVGVNTDTSMVNQTDTSDVTKVVATLVISYTLSSMVGDYACMIRYDNSMIYSEHAYLMVAGITSFPSSTLATDGGSATITMVATGASAVDSATILWYFDGTQFFDGNDDRTIGIADPVDGGSSWTSESVLEWDNIDKATADGGTITVYVELDGKTYSASSTLTVLGLYRTPTTRTLMRGITEYLYCSFDGPPQPSIAWYDSSSGIAVEIDSSLVTTEKSGTDVYISRLEQTCAVDGATTVTISCAATYSSYEGSSGIFSGGLVQSDSIVYDTVGVKSISGPTGVRTGEAATFVATIDYLSDPNTPSFNWKLNSYPLDVSGTVSQSSSTVYKIEFDISAMTAVDAGIYSVSASYDNLGTSGSLSITTEVIDACGVIPDVADGTLTCDPSDYDSTDYTLVTCVLTCDNGYQLDGSQSSWTCTDGVWEQNSATNPGNKVARCLEKQDPAKLSWLFVVTYEWNYVASCTSWLGQVYRAAWPYHMKDMTLPSDVVLTDDTWGAADYTELCTASGNDLELYALYEQTTNTGTSQFDELFEDLDAHVQADWNFDPLRTENCMEEDGTSWCIKQSCMFGNEDMFMSSIKCAARRRRSTGDDESADEMNFAGGSVGDSNANGQAKKSLGMDGLATEVKVTCNPGSVADGLTCVKCGRGMFQDGDKCSSCPVGTYQEDDGQTTCRTCPGDLGTIGEGSESVDLCDNVCQISPVQYGTTSPAAGWVVTSGSAVTVTCQEGYQYKGSNVAVAVCGEEPVCLKVEVTAASVDIIEGSDAVLTCSIVSSEEPLGCVWYHEETELYTNAASRSGSDQYECEMIVAAATAADAGAYSCSASLPGRREQARIAANLNILEITLDTSAESFVEGDMFKLFCAVSVPRHTSVSISWTKDNGKIGSVVQATSNPAVHYLTVEDSTVSDAGQYRCIAMYDSVGVATSQPKQINILGFLTKIYTHSLVTGQSSTLKCSSNEGVITLKKDGAVIASDSEYVISSAGSSDAGVYTCTASGTNHQIDATAVISVTDIGLSEHPSDLSVTLGSSATFTATVLTDSTHTDPTFTWFVNGVESKIASGADSSELAVASATERSDVYCSVEYANGVIVESKHALLDVRGFKTHPQHKEHLVGEAVTLQCTALGDDLKTINWFRDIDDGSQEYIETNTVTVGGHMTTSSLVTYYAMSYYCQAEYEGHSAIESARAGVTEYIIELEEVHAMLGAAQTMTCKLYGATKPDLISWTFNGNSIDASKISESEFDYTKSYGESYLVMDTVTDAMLGDYTCMASFVSSLSFLKSESVSLSALGFVEAPEDLIVMRTTQTPKIIFSYLHDNNVREPEVLCSNVNIVAKSTRREMDVVTFEGTIELIEGVSEMAYDCSIKYDGVGTVVSDKVSVHVLDPVTLSTASSSVMMGDIVSFTSTVSYIANIPIMTWRVDNTVTIPSTVTYNETHITSVLNWPAVDDFTVSLAVRQVNVASLVTRTKSVDVIGIKEMTGPVSPMLGRTYNLTCGAVQKSGADISFQWTRQGEIRQASSQHTSNGMVRSVLAVYSVDEDSLGLYTCTATYTGAVEGQTSSTFHLKLTGQCEVPSISHGGVEHHGVYIDSDTLVEVYCENGYEASAPTLRCVNGEFDSVLPICTKKSSALTAQIVSGLGVLLIVLCVILGVYLYKRNKGPGRNVVTPNNGFYEDDLKANLGRGGEVHSNFANERELTVVDVNYNH